MRLHRPVGTPPLTGLADDGGGVVRDLAGLLGPFGVARTANLAGRVDRHTVGRWVAAGRLLRPHPGVVALPADWEDWRTRALAGVLATDGTLSHT